MHDDVDADDDDTSTHGTKTQTYDSIEDINNDTSAMTTEPIERRTER